MFLAAGLATVTVPTTDAVAADAPACVGGKVQVEIAEVAVAPRASSFVELHNRSNQPVSLAALFLTNLSVLTWPDGAEVLADRQAGAAGAFVARFPPSATIAPDQRLVVALGGSAAFEEKNGFAPDFELFEDGVKADEIRELEEAFSGSVFRQGHLSEANDQVMVFCRGTTEELTAFDAISWGAGPVGEWKREGHSAPVEDLGQVVIHRSSGSAMRAGAGGSTEGREQLPPTVATAPAPGSSWQRRDLPDGGHDWLQTTTTPGTSWDRPAKLALGLEVLPSRPMRQGNSVLVRVALRNEGGRVTDAALVAPVPEALSFVDWVVKPEGSSVDGGALRWAGSVPPLGEVNWAYMADVGAPPALQAVWTASAADSQIEVHSEFPLQFESVAVSWTEDEDEEVEPPPSEDGKVTVTSRGEVTVESRAFLDDGEDLTQDYNAAMLGRVQADFRLGSVRSRVRATGRFDQFDPGRRALYPEELWVELKVQSVRMRAGWQTTNWSELEAFHPADVINSRFWDTKFENPEKLGEPMVSIRVPTIGNGSLQAYGMPYLVAPRWPSVESRQSPIPLGIELGDPLWLEQSGEFSKDDFAAQGAIRLEQTIKSADFGIYALNHVDRSQPYLVFDPTTMGFRPLMRPVTQVGGTFQQVLGAAILKAEGGYRWFGGGDDPTRFGVVPHPDHLLAAVGAEYGWAIGPTSNTVLVEGQGLFFEDEPTRTQLNLFESDVLVGYRLGVNDRDDKEVLLLGIFDVEDPAEWIAGIRYNQRIGDSWVGEIGVRAVHAPPQTGEFETGMGLLRDSDGVELKISRFF